MTHDPDTLRAETTAALARIPQPDAPGAELADIAGRLEGVHAMLVQALDTVEKG